MGAPSLPWPARRSASGRFLRNTPSAAPRRCRSTWTTTDPRPARRSSDIVHFMPRILRPVAAVVVTFSLVSIVHAAGARFWEVGTLNDFLKGDATSLSVDLHGRLILGP